VEPSLPDRHPFLRAADLVVRVKVTIDESGRVIRTDALSRTTANGLLVESAMQAARQSRFEPARTHGQAVRSEMIVVYQFRPR
jgi:TonB family protein